MPKRKILYPFIILILVFFGFYWIFKLNEMNEGKDEEKEKIKEEREIFFIEHPKYKNMGDQIYDFLALETSFSDEERKNHSYVLMKYFHGMITKEREVVEKFIDGSLKENVNKIMESYDNMNIENYFLHFDQRNNDMLISLVYDGEEKNHKDRVVAYQLQDQKVYEDQELDLYAPGTFINFLFDLPPLVEVLEDDQLSDLYESLVTEIEKNSVKQETIEALAASVIYSLHGLLMNQEHLVKYFTSKDAIHLEKDLKVFQKLNISNIQFEGFSSHENDQLFYLYLVLDDQGKEVPIQVKVHLLQFITVTFTYDEID